MPPHGGPEQVSSGAGASAADLYREHGAFVARLAYRLMGRDDDVEDVVQDVFCDLLRQYQRLTDRDALKGWLATVAVRAVRKRLRRRRLRVRLGLDAEVDYETVPAVGASPESRAFLTALYKRLAKLPTDQRLAWSLRHLEDESLETVAARCEVSLATAKRKIAAAHAFLTEELKPWTDS